MIKDRNDFLGANFIWFIGVVEDRNDPLKLGRCRVRCIGWHSDSKAELPTNSLPWSQPLQPITSAGVSGKGTTPLGLVEGSWVVGFFLDGKDAQQPIILGSISSIPTALGSATSQNAFADPNGVYPIYANEPDTNRRARNENVTIRSDLDSTTSGFDASWSEPLDPYAAVYPKNHVRESESGHYEEWDDTPGAERLKKHHSSGTFEEIFSDGTKLNKIVKDNYTIIANDDNILIKGTANITIDGNCNLIVGGDLDHMVNGDYNLKILGSYNRTVTGETHIRYDGDKHVHTGADTYSRHDSGTDFSCPDDPIRTSDNDCSDVNEAS